MKKHIKPAIIIAAAIALAIGLAYVAASMAPEEDTAKWEIY